MGEKEMVKSEERMLAAAIYVLSLFVPVIGPLIIWLLKKDESSFVDYHGKEYFNFLISYTIYSVVCWVYNPHPNWFYWIGDSRDYGPSIYNYGRS
jgi:uncharacterized Tic20 family protein